jgi:hypothetical protein
MQLTDASGAVTENSSFCWTQAYTSHLRIAADPLPEKLISSFENRELTKPKNQETVYSQI